MHTYKEFCKTIIPYAEDVFKDLSTNDELLNYLPLRMFHIFKTSMSSTTFKYKIRPIKRRIHGVLIWGISLKLTFRELNMPVEWFNNTWCTESQRKFYRCSNVERCFSYYYYDETDYSYTNLDSRTGNWTYTIDFHICPAHSSGKIFKQYTLPEDSLKKFKERLLKVCTLPKMSHQD